MKSINEWRTDLISEDLDIDPMAARKFMGDTTVKVDPRLKSSLRSKIEQLKNEPEFAGASNEEFFRAVVAAAWSIIGDVKGNAFGVGAGLKRFGDDDMTQGGAPNGL